LSDSLSAGTEARITRFVAGLLATGCALVSEWPLTVEVAEELGLRREGDLLLLPAPWDPLDTGRIRDALSARAGAWLRAIEVRAAIGSTNAELVERARAGSIAGHVCLAELQLAGRGRRGRTWLSPLGGNLALSLGFEASRPTAELGGFSLVVGIAVVDALESCGVEGLSLKWPNDILLNGAKLGGILIELVQGEGAISLVVGVGLNVRLPVQARHRLDQVVADLASIREDLPGRSELAGRLISSIVEFEAGFSAAGFGPFAPVFDRRHAYRDADVEILQGDRSFAGRVLGVELDGGLRIHAAIGDVVVHGGEVSLRPGSGAPD